MPNRRSFLAGVAATALIPALPRIARAGSGTALLADLSRLPAGAFTRPAGEGVASWYSPAAMAALGIGAGQKHRHWRRVLNGFAPEQMQQGLGGGWKQTVGFGADDMVSVALWQAAPSVAVALVLAPGVAAGVPAALTAKGYAEVTQDGLTALAKGERDNALDFAGRDASDPFGGLTGKSSRLRIEGDLLLQASTWPLLADLSGKGTAQGHPDLAGLVSAIEAAIPTDAVPLQAMVLNDQAALGAAMPGTGIAPWRLGLVVDAADATTDHTLVLFSYDTAALATEAMARLESLWPQQPQAAHLAPPRFSTAEGALPVALLHFATPRGDTAENLTLRAILFAIVMRELPLFGL